MVAPGSTPPVVSVMTPWMVASCCAKLAIGTAATRVRARIIDRRSVFKAIGPPPGRVRRRPAEHDPGGLARGEKQILPGSRQACNGCVCMCVASLGPAYSPVNRLLDAKSELTAALRVFGEPPRKASLGVLGVVFAACSSRRRRGPVALRAHEEIAAVWKLHRQPVRGCRSILGTVTINDDLLPHGEIGGSQATFQEGIRCTS